MRLLLMILVCVFCAVPSYAGFLPAYDLLTLVQDAEIIAVGHTGEIQLDKTGTLETGGSDAKGQKVFAPVQFNQTLFEAGLLIKGRLTNKSILIFPTPVSQKFEQNALPSFVFPQIKPASNFLLFLKRTPINGQYTLVYPLNLYGSAIPLPPVFPKLQDEYSPLRKILLLLTTEIPRAKGKEILPVLERLRQVAPLLYIPLDDTRSLNYSAETATLRKSLGETEPGLEDWIAKMIVPKVRLLLKDTDPEVRREAVLTAAYLQDISVMAQVIKLAEAETLNGPQEANIALRQYRAPQAIKGLTVAIKHPNVVIRRQAAFALSSIMEVAITPVLVNLLDDSDEKVRNYAIAGLFSLFNEKGSQGKENGTPSQAQVIQFWRDWSVKNDKIIQDAQERLKNQFLK